MHKQVPYNLSTASLDTIRLPSVTEERHLEEQAPKSALCLAPAASLARIPYSVIGASGASKSPACSKPVCCLSSSRE